MRTIRFLLRKEFLQIFRNKAMLPVIFLLPVIQLIVLSFAATYELKEARFIWVDHDRSELSESLLQRLEASGYLTLSHTRTDPDEGVRLIDRNQSDFMVVIPERFSADHKTGKWSELQLLIDAVDGTKAGLIQSYVKAMINDHLRELNTEIGNSTGSQPLIRMKSRNWYNPDLDYITFMVPGILVVLVSMIGLFLSGMNIVREREIGTIEQLNVAPITRTEFMTGKLIPFWVIGMGDLLIGLGLARFVFHIPFLGNLGIILTIAGLYLILIQALGLLISTVTDTQQQAMFIAWFLMVVFILMGGLFTPIESMPVWAQNLNLLNPAAQFIQVMRMVLLKGAGWKEVLFQTTMIGSMGIVVLLLAVSRYKKTTG